MLIRTLLRPTWAPPSDGTTPPASPAGEAPAPGAETGTEETPNSDNSGSTQGEPSASAEAGDKPAEPTAEEKAAAEAEAARAVVPEEAAGYAINLDEEAKAALRLADEADPIVAGLRNLFKAEGLTQGAFDDFLATAAKAAKAGLFDTGFDLAAETAKLGENAEGRRRDIEIFADALKGREGFDEEMHGELMSLAPSAAGVRLVEFLRGQMGDAGKVDPPAGGDGGGEAVSIERARELRRDPRYESDPKFRKEADRVWQEAHRKAR
jgi:hypothetical protein